MARNYPRRKRRRFSNTSRRSEGAESKTNFFAAVSQGDTVRAECTPLHRGRTTMVWETRIFRRDGRLVAIVTQTQLVMTQRP
jgi:uncharacterized protein (TIGR00369 family)